MIDRQHLNGNTKLWSLMLDVSTKGGSQGIVRTQSPDTFVFLTDK